MCDDGRGQLYFVWDAGTDRGGAGGASFSCDSLIDFPLASAASCVWTTDSELTATLDYRATCVPGDNITVRADVLKVRWRSHRVASRRVLSVAATLQRSGTAPRRTILPVRFRYTRT